MGISIAYEASQCTSHPVDWIPPQYRQGSGDGDTSRCSQPPEGAGAVQEEGVHGNKEDPPALLVGPGDPAGG